MKILVIISLTWLLASCSGSGIKKDETVVFFPTSAHLNTNGNWSLPIHHWVLEKEENDLSRIFAKKALSEMLEGLGVSEKQSKTPRTQERLMWFLVDNKRNKQVNIFLNNKLEQLNQTTANGHANTTLLIAKSAFKPIPAKNMKKEGGWVSIKAQDKYNRDFSGEVQLIPETGLSVISDIDDTIKISEVLNKKALIKNIFAKPYKATSGFPAYYQQLQQQGAYFHYVSASPWQLYPSLQAFMQIHYPKGTISLRNFRIKDSSLIKFLGSSQDYKIKTISNIIKRYPKHQFILIGDSGEHDPEVYTEIYRKFPNNIQSIQIRVVEGSDMNIERFNKLFKVAPKVLWKIFSAPEN